MLAYLATSALVSRYYTPSYRPAIDAAGDDNMGLMPVIVTVFWQTYIGRLLREHMVLQTLISRVDEYWSRLVWRLLATATVC